MVNPRDIAGERRRRRRMVNPRDIAGERRRRRRRMMNTRDIAGERRRRRRMVNPRDIAGERRRRRRRKVQFETFTISSLHHELSPTHRFISCLSNDTNNNTSDNHIKKHNPRLLQSPHCTTNCLQHIRSSGQSTIMCKSHGTHRALVMCNMLCTTWYEGTAQLVCQSLNCISTASRVQSSSGEIIRWRGFFPWS